MKVILADINQYNNTLHFSVNFYALYLLATFIPDILHIDNELVKNGFWGLKVLLACWVIVNSRIPLSSITKSELLFWLLIFIYTLNLYIDIFLDTRYFITGSRGLTDFISFILCIIVAISFRYDPAFHSKKSFNYFWITLTIGLVIAYFLATESFELDSANVRYDANSTFNSINYGIAGCSLSLISVFGIVKSKKGVLRLLFLITFAVGLLSIAKAGSRSPVVVLAVVCAFYFVARLGTAKGIIAIVAVLGLTIFFLEDIIIFLDSMGSSLGVRLNNMITEKETSGRDSIYENTLNIINQSPILGSYYVISSGVGFKGYPHNFILEVFMATGLIGGIPFMILLFVSLAKAYKLLKTEHPASWIVILYLQVVCYGMFSTSLFSSQDFWALLLFVLSINILTRGNRKESLELSESEVATPAHRTLVLSK